MVMIAQPQCFSLCEQTVPVSSGFIRWLGSVFMLFTKIRDFPLKKSYIESYQNERCRLLRCEFIKTKNLAIIWENYKSFNVLDH